MHNKIIIFESNKGANDKEGKPLVVIGSFNITNAAAESSCEDILILDNENAIVSYIEEFHEMHGKATPGNIYAADNPKESNEKLKNKKLSLEKRAIVAMHKNKMPLVSFRFNIRELVKNLINWEQEQIDGAQFRFTLYDVADAWCKKKIGGTVIVDKDFKKELTQALDCLQKHKVSIRVIDELLMHHKFFLFKRNKNNVPVLLVGSANMTGQSIENNWENVVALEDVVVINQFDRAFKALLKKTRLVEPKELVYVGQPPSKWQKQMNGLPIEEEVKKQPVQRLIKRTVKK